MLIFEVDDVPLLMGKVSRSWIPSKNIDHDLELQGHKYHLIGVIYYNQQNHFVASLVTKANGWQFYDALSQPRFVPFTESVIKNFIVKIIVYIIES